MFNTIAADLDHVQMSANTGNYGPFISNTTSTTQQVNYIGADINVVVPEPVTVLLLLSGLGVMWLFSRRQTKQI